MDLVERYLAFFSDNDLNLSEARVALAVSTGSDSMALLSAAMEARSRVPHTLIIFHVNHHVREQSAEEERYITRFASVHELPLVVIPLHVPAGPGFEAAAHEARHQAFVKNALLWRADILLTAHHASDALETVLMRISRGSGLLGYIGLSALSSKDGLLVGRPFLDCTKEDLRAHCLAHGIKWYEDETNETDDVLRNRIRHEAVPCLAEAGALQALSRYRAVLQGAYETVNKALEPFLASVSETDNEKTFAREAFLSLSPYLQEEALYRLIRPETPSSASVHAALAGIAARAPSFTIVLTDWTLERSYESITLRHARRAAAPIPTITIDGCGEHDLGDNLWLVVRKKCANEREDASSLWYNESDLPVTARARSCGDRIVTTGGTKKVKSLLIDDKVPRASRERTVIIEKDGRILAVLGHARAESANLTESGHDIVISLAQKKEG